MNFCNFGKVLIARASKDLTAIKLWTEEKSKNQPTSNINSNFSTNINDKDRYYYYKEFTSGYSKMKIDQAAFRIKSLRIQNYLTDKKYWINKNKSGEQKKFLDYFSMKNWMDLPHEEKKTHTIEDCLPCTSIHSEISNLHVSQKAKPIAKEVVSDCEKATNKIINLTSPMSSNSKQKGIQVLKAMVGVIQPIIEKKLDVKFDRKMAGAVTLSPPIDLKTHTKEVLQTASSSKKKFQENLMKADDVKNFLKSGKSYSQYNKDRLDAFFESKVSARKRVTKQLEKESKGLKQKVHHGRFDRYHFDRIGFMNEVRTITDDSTNWTSLARKYNMKLNGKFPLNGGQVLFEYAKEQGVDVLALNKTRRIAKRDYRRRIRRAKAVIFVKNTKLSMPTSRPVKEMRNEIERQRADGTLYIGERVAPKKYQKTKIGDNGALITKTFEIFGRKYPLDFIRKETLEEHLQLGIIRYVDYEKMSNEELRENISSLGGNPSIDPEENKQKLKSLHSTRYMKFWHDHSSILNHSYVCFTVSWIYNTANFLTDEEYRCKYPDKNPINIQTIVEKPKMYIFGQSGSTDIEQTTYIDTRIQDLSHVTNPITVDGIEVRDIVRVFSGDGPAREFEFGQQRGGNFPCICGVNASDHTNLIRCYKMDGVQNFDKRKQLSTASFQSREKLKSGILNPFQNLKKNEIIEELDCRNIDYQGEKKSELQEELTALLHGIARPPALMLTTDKSAEELNIGRYEVFGFEPLHDICNVVCNIITEMPYQFNDQKLQKTFINFQAKTIGQKNQVKGSDARLYCIQLAKLAQELHDNQELDEVYVLLLNSLVEIIHICYSDYFYRTPRTILRLFNQCLIFATCCKSIFGIPKKMNSRKFFGNHFHELTIHAPEIYRIISHRSLVTENEERCFGKLRKLAESTTNRQPGHIIDGTILRYLKQQEDDLEEDNLQRQESEISKQSKFLKQGERSVFKAAFVEKRSLLMQAHLERIADFMNCGEGVWWFMEDGDLIFKDGPNDVSTNPNGPELHNFRTFDQTKEKEYVSDNWNSVISKFEKGLINLPVKKIKVFVDGKVKYVTRDQMENYNGNLGDEQKTGQISDDKVPLYAGVRFEDDKKSGQSSEDTIPLYVAVRCDDKNESEEQNEPRKTELQVMNDDAEGAAPSISSLPRIDKAKMVEDYALNTATAISTRQTDTGNKEVLDEYHTMIRGLQRKSGDTNKERHSTDRSSQRRKGVKRKLFETNSAQKLDEKSNKKTILDLAENLLGGNANEIIQCRKFKDLLLKFPNNKSFKSSYDLSEAKLQTAVSRKHNFLLKKLEAEGNNQELMANKHLAQRLLKHWNITVNW